MSISYPPRKKQLQKLIEKLGLPETAPVKWQLLDLALTHPTVSSTANYEQLEFLGDAVVRLAASEFLMETYPESSVGEFSAIRKVIVSDRTLASLADSYGLDRYLLISDSAAGDKAGLESRLADAFEAVLGALYLSTHTLELVRPWLDLHFKHLAAEIRLDPALQNYKDALQEWTQAHYKVLPIYRVRETVRSTGSHERFTAEVWLQDRQLGVGLGHSKKAAEQAAAKQAFLGILGDGK
ncbi:ribonuclease III [Microcoleus sp. FACHB-831]|uniref:ribonuclease III n=1 Tax=Microcoleus sp. FACHB-831 TaxID=2692827 RepID=UPI0016859857|nr:ribonuclease III [Microcoleus sp. FACHB-831]MBD1924597.1 ribonuclease III [Microcoleus sp. FACHB-831]